ncbi:ATP:cob(I)alamin adenosyltransferase [Sulfolobus sp. A20]|uniref:cob(I)yrinic acid a,c-diamide adenosyltransferase n=1 Tax=Saccharolobus sp. A20 TaxID=1891280 RepID=UPI0008460CFC|nr:cob(I)yrinic acid a,c-diamide adenosyltransferase [Sulfolobus sp. A20]TRM76238.1 cob(I)yrinic acid a,c-diamide adenosyltransferase [Sulfolobus sp. E5]TRM76726.1 cob(I)yrinic acid a,c-diamide adenosyltransferase [Sulfolobus sp. A20-N-F8]TRM80278.1 cob(I)yrinic acid a,c-diamide adenosyltransferase [Sulfolobus sp. D5]TRM86269.1 cob(I)yrinic acid a,c-diamide adenosyltransferase [Sulfolobus sp. E3]TRM87698.1 cob(I)yrinic acid a,c-diamide adenosyltransferase [Sulfolobus sp. C3]TRN02464.1 cob(I)y
MFTRTGDDGNTNVINKRIGKDSPLVNFLGDIDELNSFIGFALSVIKWEDIRQDLMRVQQELFIVGEEAVKNEGKITEESVKWIEKRTVEYRKESGPVKLFVIPGGSEEASRLHVVRSVARRIERNAVKYSKEVQFNKWIIVYLNRLSSLLFAMAIVANKRNGVEERIYDIGKYF